MSGLTVEQMAKLHMASFTTPRPWSADEIRDLLASPLCFAESRTEGFAMARVVAGEAEILTIAVDPGARGQGHGRALLAAILEQAAARGATQAFLEVAEDNPAALALYQTAGFAQTGRRRGYYKGPAGDARDALVLTRGL